MAIMDSISKEQRMEIANLYKDKNIKTREICDTYNLSTRQLTKIVHETGGELRRPKINKHNNKKKCPHCRRFVNVADAKFCCYCGEDIRTEADIICERLNALLSTLVFLPSGEKDKSRDTILEALAYIKNQKGANNL